MLVEELTDRATHDRGGPLIDKVSRLWRYYSEMYQAVRQRVRYSPVLIDNQAVVAAATLDLGDIDGDAWADRFYFVDVDLYSFQTDNDGDLITMRLGAGGAWKTSNIYSLAGHTITADGTPPTNTVWSLPAQTAATFWPVVAGQIQGSVTNSESAFGHMRLYLSPVGVLSRHGWDGVVTYGNQNGEHVSSWFSGQYPSADQISGLRFYYGVGNITGRARVRGWPR